jgi:phage gp29-like protein
MAKRFSIPPIPKGEVAQYVGNPYLWSLAYGQVPNVGSSDTLVRPQDDLLIQKGGIQALNIYQRLLFDSNVQAAWLKVSQEITSRDLVVDSASDLPGDIAVKEFVEEQIQDLPMDEIFRGLLEAYVVGFSVGEVMWRRTASGVKAYDVRMRDPRRFRFQENEEADMGFTMRMVTRQNMFLGEELPARKFITFRYWTQANGDPYGCGLGRILYPIVKFKRRALESQLLYSDRFANPTAVATAPLAATTQEIDTLYNHLQNLSQETALILPEGYNLEFINPAGSPDTFTTIRDSLIKEINMLITGEDETGNADSGSRASSEVALQVREVRAKELSELLCETLNESLVRWIVDLNFGTSIVAPKLRRDFKLEEGSTLTMTDVGTMIEKVGFRPTREWIEETYKVELEAEEDTVAEGPPPVIPTPEEEMGAGEDLGSPPELPAEGEEGEEGGDEVDLDSLIDEILGGSAG